MSYDFRLFKRKPGEDPETTARAESDGLPATPPDPQKELLKRKIGDLLIARNPKFEYFQFEYEQIAQTRKISVEEARRLHRHLELNNLAKDSNGIRITLYDDEASITVPYYHIGEKAADVFREIWGYMEIITRESGYLVYDNQIDRILDLSAGCQDSLACYTGTSQPASQTITRGGVGVKPWWKFW
jgi:hypothetical protein